MEPTSTRRLGRWHSAVAVALVGVSLYAIRANPSFETRLANAVNVGSCLSVTTRSAGYNDDGVVNERAGFEFSAFCNNLGPSVQWLAFASDAKMNAAIAASAPALKGEALCLSPRRAQLLNWIWDSGSSSYIDRDLERLCTSINGRMVRAP